MVCEVVLGELTTTWQSCAERPEQAQPEISEALLPAHNPDTLTGSWSAPLPPPMTSCAPEQKEEEI